MARVPTVQRQVSPTALPGARLTATETPESQGAGVEYARANKDRAIADFAGTGLQIAGGLYANALKEERQKANTVAVLEASNKTDHWINQRLYTPETGALNQKGKNALGLPESVRTEYEKFSGEIEASLTTPEQKAAYAKIRAQQGQSIDSILYRHTAGEIQSYTAQELQATVANKTASAAANAFDPRKIGEDRDAMLTAIDAVAPGLGIGKEGLEQMKLKATTGLHTGVIDRLLGEDQWDKAKDYYAEVKGEIAGDQRAAVEKELEEGTLRGQSQQKADEIVMSGKDFGEQLEDVRKISDPKLRDAVRERVEHENDVKKSIDRERDQDTLRAAYDTVDEKKDVGAIPWKVWSKLDGSSRSALQSYAKSLVERKPIQTDYGTYYTLYTEARNDPDSFSTKNLLRYKAVLDDGDWKELVRLQGSIVKGDKSETASHLAGFGSQQDVVDGALVEYGIDPNAKNDTPQGASNARLRSQVRQQVDMLQADGKTKVTHTELRQIVDRLMSVNVDTVEKGWLWNSNVSKRLIDVTIEDIPASDQADLRRALESRGQDATPATILALYRNIKLRKGR